MFFRNNFFHKALDKVAIDKFLQALALDGITQKTSFPKKLELLRKLNAFPTRMVEIINKKRNIIEHAYSPISIEEAEEFVDITEMFLMLIYPLLKQVIVGVIVGLDQDDRCYDWGINHETHTVDIYEQCSGEFIDTHIGRIHHSFESLRKEKDRLLDSQKPRFIDSIKINKTNIEIWIPFFDLFVYCTKKKSLELREPDQGEGSYITTFACFLWR